jgi:cell division protein FtsW
MEESPKKKIILILNLAKMSPKNKIDSRLLFALFIALVFGLTMIASAGISYSRARFGDPYYFFKHQIVYGIIPGLAALYLTQKINYKFWKKVALPFFAVTVFFLILVFVPGFESKIYGASRWLQLGSFSFQPSEMLKLSIIIYLAAWLENKVEKVRNFSEGAVPFFIIVGLIGFLLIKQPDIGTLGVTVMIAISIFFVSGADFKHLFLMGAFGVLALFVLIKMETYRLNRFLVFLHPETDPQGIGYQINQALLAIGSGGFWGVGLGHSLQKFNYLPEPIGDSIFAIIGEELGFLGCVFLISLFVYLAAKGFRIAKRAPDRFAKLLATGITAWIVCQAFINIASISGLMPLTGIPLPFVSYGGTSLVFLMAASGILLNISKYAKED